MAENTDRSISIKASDEVFDNCCSPCSRNGVIKEATKYCHDCGSYICIQCVRDHSKIPALQSHQIADRVKTEYQSNSKYRQGLSRERCDTHHGRILDRYCWDHDEVCCGACIAIKHRSCENIKDINESAKNINTKELGDTNEGLDKVISKIILEQDKRRFHLSTLDQEKTSILKDIDNFQDSLTKRIKELAEASRKEVLSKYDKVVDAIQGDVIELETVLSLSAESSKTLNKTGLDDTQTFVSIKKSKKITQNVAETVDALSTNWRKCALDYCFEVRPFQKVKLLKSFGHFEENINTPYSAEKQGMISVKFENDGDCVITGICLLENDTMVIADYKNKKLKRLNESYEMRDSIVFAGPPSSLCKTGNQEVAVALRNEGKVQFVSCDKTLSLGTSFSTTQRCTGLYFDTKHDELYVSCDSWARVSQSKVCVYKKSGDILRTFEIDEDGKGLFTYPKNIVMEPITDMVYIADERKGVIALDRNGKRQWIFKDPKLKDLCGICLLPGNQLMVTGSSSKNLVQVGDDGKEVCELIDASKGLNNPYTVVCDRRNSRILVGCASNEICFYTIHRK